MTDRRSFEINEKIDPSIVFEKEDSTAADFEIAFAALVATAVLSFPTASTSFFFIKLAAILLVFTTLIRRMAVLSSYTDTRRVTDLTTTVLLLLTYLCFLYLMRVFSVGVSAYLPDIVNPVMIMGICVSLAYVSFLLLQEVIFRDLFLYAAIAALNSGVDSNNRIFQQKFGQLAVKAAQMSLAGEAFPSELNWLRYTSVDTSESPTIWDKVGYYLGLLLALILYLVAWSAAVFVLGESISTIIVLATTLLVSIPVKFLYERYGLTPLLDDRRARTDATALVVGFLLAVWLFV